MTKILLISLISISSFALDCVPYKGNLELGKIKVSTSKSKITIYFKDIDATVNGKFLTYMQENIKYELETIDPETKWHDTVMITLKHYGPRKTYFLTITEAVYSRKIKTEFECI